MAPNSPEIPVDDASLNRPGFLAGDLAIWLVLLLLMLMPMLMKLALTPMLLLYAFDVAKYVAVDDANADAKMPIVARHLVGAYAVVLMPTWLRLLRQLMLAMIQC